MITNLTGDIVTDVNLSRLKWTADSAVADEKSLETLGAVIRQTRRMLPAAVDRHFSWPQTFTRLGSHLDPTMLDRLLKVSREALSAGLASIRADPTLQTPATADLSDRPPSVGEMIEQAYSQCLKRLSPENLAEMERRVSQTGEPGAITMVAKASRMKSETAILRELGKIQMRAWGFHHIPARQPRFRQ